MYVRNEEQVPSTLYSIRSHESIGENYRPLFEKMYKIPKDANLKPVRVRKKRWILFYMGIISCHS
jgi:hypothetical protein